MQNDKLDHFVLKEINRGSFAEIIEVDEDKYTSNVVSKQSLEKINFERIKSGIILDNFATSHPQNRRKSFSKLPKNQTNNLLMSTDTDKDFRVENFDTVEPQRKSCPNGSRLRQRLHDGIVEVSDDLKLHSGERESSRSMTYISLSPSHKRSIANETVKETKQGRQMNPKISTDDNRLSPMYYSEKPRQYHPTKFSSYKHNYNSPLIANANNHINININISNDKLKGASEKRHSVHTHSSNVNYKPIIDEIKRRRNLTAKDKYNKSLSFNTQITGAILGGIEVKKQERQGRFSIDSKKTRLNVQRG